jgi:hypothetical protein
LLRRNALLQPRRQDALVGDHPARRHAPPLPLLLPPLLLLMPSAGTCNEASAIATDVGLRQGNSPSLQQHIQILQHHPSPNEIL